MRVWFLRAETRYREISGSSFGHPNRRACWCSRKSGSTSDESGFRICEGLQCN